MHLRNSILQSFLTLALLVDLPTLTLGAPAAITDRSQDVLASPALLQQQQSQDDSFPHNAVKRPTRHESTVLARRLLALSRTGVVSTVFPSKHSSSAPVPDLLLSHDSLAVPKSVAGSPVGQPEYIADCGGDERGDPTLIALDVEINTQNALAGSNVSLSISWWDEYVKLVGREPWATANLPRVSIVGWLEELSEKEVREGRIEECFLEAHHDAKLWLPGDGAAAHSGHWMRVVVEEVYWIGGFGNAHWIGWFDVEEWRAVTRKEWEGVRLPGEER